MVWGETGNDRESEKHRERQREREREGKREKGEGGRGFGICLMQSHLLSVNKMSSLWNHVNKVFLGEDPSTVISLPNL